MGLYSFRECHLTTLLKVYGKEVSFSMQTYKYLKRMSREIVVEKFLKDRRYPILLIISMRHPPDS